MILRGKGANGRFGNAGFPVRDFDDGMFEAGRFREQENGFIFRRTGRMRKQKSGAGSRRGAKKIASS